MENYLSNTALGLSKKQATIISVIALLNYQGYNTNEINDDKYSEKYHVMFKRRLITLTVPFLLEELNKMTGEFSEYTIKEIQELLSLGIFNFSMDKDGVLLTIGIENFVFQKLNIACI